MYSFNVGKREHNKAVQKLAILEAFIKHMAKCRLHEINVEEVCKEIGISKVTFFNYFKSKDEIVEYFILLWNYQMHYEISENNLRGKQALYHYFDRVSEHESVMSIMTALIAFFSKVTCYKPTYISDYELFLYNEKAYHKGYRNKKIHDIFYETLEEMGYKTGQIGPLLTNIMSGFYGIAFVKGLGYGENLKDSYRDFLDTILKGGPDEV